MPDKTVPSLPAAAALDGSEILYVAQGANDVRTTTSALAALVKGGQGQCRLRLVSTNLVLSPFNGNIIMINSLPVNVPDAGVSLAATGLVVGTTYFIYAYMVGATMTLEASVTAHATQAGTGVEIKSGDATRSLVGMARPITGPAWVNSPAQRFVISWYNRYSLSLYNNFKANYSNNNTTPVEMRPTDRCEFLSWANTPILGTFSGYTFGTQATFILFAVGMDASPSTAQWSATENYGYGEVVTAPNTFDASEGYHFINAYAYTSNSTNTYTVGSGSGAFATVTGMCGIG